MGAVVANAIYDAVGVRIYEFDSDLRLARVRRAESGHFLQAGRWQLKDVKVTDISGDSARQVAMPEAVWETVLRPSILTVYQVAPERLEQVERDADGRDVHILERLVMLAVVHHRPRDACHHRADVNQHLEYRDHVHA